MSNVYCRAMSVLGCQPAALKIRKSCTQDCCDGENCISWFDKQFSRLAAYEESGLLPKEVQELAKAKAEGRLVVLPCKVGDTVYAIHNIPNSDKKVMVEVQADLFFIVLSTCEGRFGKTVFLTREAAEKALKEACT